MSLNSLGIVSGAFLAGNIVGALINALQRDAV